MKRLLLLSVALLLLPVMTRAAGPDLSIAARDIRFSESTLVSGETIRIYAAIENDGDEDATAYVFFYQGTKPIGASQMVTVSADGYKDEVWVDFTVPYGPFNIRAEIRGQDPGDVNSSNDLAVTSLYTPVNDEDGDGIPAEEDNCPENANADQKDSDGDGVGDVCDDDDDNDGLSDEIEQELGTDSTSSDSDGDGATDAGDAAPLDPNIQTLQQQQEAEAAAQEQEQGVDDVEQDVVEEVESDQEDVDEEDVEEEGEQGFSLFGIREPEAILQVSSNASFSYSPVSWKTYHFRVLIPEEADVALTWDFGDGVTSAQPDIEHTFRAPGRYIVTLKASDEMGETTVDSEEIHVSFFHIANPYIKLLIGLLALVLLTSLAFSFRRGGSRAPVLKKRKRSEQPLEEFTMVVEEDSERPVKKSTKASPKRNTKKASKKKASKKKPK